jgi:hypothetical protein
MISSLGLVLGLAQVSPYSLAYVARFYRMGTAKSRFELYLSNFDGQKRLLLPTKEEPNQAQWLGTNKIAFTTESGLWVGSISKWAPKLIKKGSDIHFKESRWRINEPGNPEVELDYEQTECYQIDPKGEKLIATSAAPDEGMIQLGDSPVEVPNPNEPMKPFVLKQFEGFDYDDEGRKMSSVAEAQYAIAGKNKKEVWIFCGTHSSTSGSINSLYYFKEGESPRILIEDANGFDFWRKRNTFAFCTSRTTTSLGNKKVWSSELHVGDWKKGTKKVIVKGLAWVGSVSIRPASVK